MNYFGWNRELSTSAYFIFIYLMSERESRLSLYFISFLNAWPKYIYVYNVHTWFSSKIFFKETSWFLSIVLYRTVFFYNIVEGEIWINVLLLLCTYYIVLDLLEWFPPKRNPNTAFKTMHMYLTGGLNAGNGNEAVLYYYLSIKWKVHTYLHIRILVMCVS